jgi:hypothetical protein
MYDVYDNILISTETWPCIDAKHPGQPGPPDRVETELIQLG